MAHYKRQHYLPAAYLKYFSDDQNNCRRSSHVWRIDSEISIRVPVVSQCASDYFYSRTKAAEVEKMFQTLENLYCECIDRIRAGKSLNPIQYGNLLSIMFDFGLRNIAHENHTASEGIEAYSQRNRLFFHQTLLGRTGGSTDKNDLREHLERNWSMKILEATPGRQFLTSDNPSIWTTLRRDKPSLDLVTLPLTPTHIAIAFDTRVAEVVKESLDNDDERNLNSGQIGNATACVFASGKLPQEQLTIIQDHLGNRTKNLCRLTDKGWQFVIQSLLPGYGFSFLRMTPPIL